MSRLQDHLTRACQALGLEIRLDYRLQLSSSQQVIAHAHIPQLGATNGMIIVKSFDEIRGVTSDLIGQGFGYSVLSDPGKNESFDLQSYVEMFSEWGWSGGHKKRPEWIISTPEE